MSIGLEVCFENILKIHVYRTLRMSKYTLFIHLVYSRLQDPKNVSKNLGL